MRSVTGRRLNVRRSFRLDRGRKGGTLNLFPRQGLPAAEVEAHLERLLHRPSRHRRGCVRVLARTLSASVKRAYMSNQPNSSRRACRLMAEFHLSLSDLQRSSVRQDPEPDHSSSASKQQFNANLAASLERQLAVALPPFLRERGLGRHRSKNRSKTNSKRRRPANDL